MDITPHTSLLLFTIVAAGINSGAFFAFSNFVMGSLGRLEPADGVRAMQEINRAAPNPLFMVTLMGGGFAGVVLAAAATGSDGDAWQLAGGLLSAATAVITAVYHVPRNNALDRVDADGTDGQRLWREYLVSWTRGNHVRTATSVASVVCLVVAATA